MAVHDAGQERVQSVFEARGSPEEFGGFVQEGGVLFRVSRGLGRFHQERLFICGRRRDMDCLMKETTG
jgi:hypothetical protein